MTSRVANLKRGVTWPMPGLGRTTMWGFAGSATAMLFREITMLEIGDVAEREVRDYGGSMIPYI